MIVERLIEESLELLDQEMMTSPMNLAYYYAGSGSPVSDSGSSPTHSTYSGPGSPSSDSEPAGSLSASWPGTKRAGQELGIARQQKGPFQGVRVKNPVRELLMQKRRKSVHGAEEYQKPRPGVNVDQYTELKNILRINKRTHDFSTEGPAAKQSCSFPSSTFLTPPGTPNSSEGMDEASKTESLDLLQSIINIKNESNPVSLNTVQVSWMNSLPQNDNAQDQQFQENILQNFTSQTSQPFCSPPQTNEGYSFGPLQIPDVASNPSTDYGCFNEASAIPNYPQSLFSNEGYQSCSMESYVLGPTTPPEFMPGKQAELCIVVQTSQNVPPQPCHPDRNNPSPFQMGKSFFQWQIEQEESKLANVSQEQLLSKDSDGDTYLHISVAQGKRALSYVIARRMASVSMLDVKEHKNQSALQVAVAANQHLIVQDLICLGAQVSTTDYWGRTPLHVCSTKGYSQVLQAIQKGLTSSNQYIDVETTNYDGLTALHCAVIAHNAIVQQLQKNRQNHLPEGEELLLKNKAMVDTVKTLLQMGASVEAKDRKSGRTAVHLAAEEANLELLSLFLELPHCLSFINTKAYNGNTALHVAASLQYRTTHLGAVRLLMRKGADPSARNLENEQPVHLVAEGPVGEEIRRVLKGKATQHRSSPY
ncbi:NF-kappa-B inhibitor zeta isoform 2-T2 [Pelodytes ibericus]